MGGNIAFNNSGTVNVQTGLLVFSGGDGGSTTGDFNISIGAILRFASNFNLAATADVAGAGNVEFNSGTINLGGTYNITGATAFTGATVNFNAPITSLGTGPLNVSGGTVNFNSNAVTVPALNLIGGNLGGTADLTSTGLLSWNIGTIAGSGAINANGGLALTGNSGLSLFGRSLNNAAGQTATLSGSTTSLNFGNGALFNNNGTFLAQSDGGFGTLGGTGNAFNNLGTFTRNTGTGTFTVGGGIAFNNSGTVNVQQRHARLERRRWREHDGRFQRRCRHPVDVLRQLQLCRDLGFCRRRHRLLQRRHPHAQWHLCRPQFCASTARP